MVRTGSSRAADSAYAASRLAVARSFLRAAEAAFAVADAGEPMNPVGSNIALAAIAYCDSLTAKYAGKVNQRDHSAVVALVRAALGNRFPKTHEAALRRMLGDKDEFQYGVRPVARDEAQRTLLQLRAFASWVEDEMSRQP